MTRPVPVLANSGYYLDPNETARRVMRIIAQHEKINNIEEMKLSSQWYELGINELDFVEIMVGVEQEFSIEIEDEALEKFKDINDAVQYISRSFWAI